MAGNIIEIISKRIKKEPIFTPNNDRLTHCLNGIDKIHGLIVESSKMLVGGLDIECKKEDGTPIHFSLGIGPTSLFYLNNSDYPNRVIIKSKPSAVITDSRKLEGIIRSFIFNHPTLQEIVNVSPQAMKAKMHKNDGNPPKIPNWMTRGNS